MKPTALAVLFAAVLSTSAALAHHTVPGAKSGPYTLQLVDEHGNALRTFRHRGRTYVLGAQGQRYLLRVQNDSGRRIEVVASVDGRDVVDGRPARLEKRGYIVDAYSHVLIDGFRTSEASVAAFRFSSVPQSYAAQMGNARDVGVIGVAVFSEQAPVYVPYNPPPLADERPHTKAESAPSAEPAPAEAPSAAGNRAPSASKKADGRSGLGTEFGEQHASHVNRVTFVRASGRPDTTLTMRYNDRSGLIALGIDVDGSRYRSDLYLRETAEPFRENGVYAQPPPNWNR